MEGEFLPRSLLDLLEKAETLSRTDFRIPDEVWAEIIYRFALAAHRRVMNREHLLKSLTPLYIGRTASFMKETAESDAGEVEELIERLCITFENSKTLLTEAWSAQTHNAGDGSCGQEE